MVSLFEYTITRFRNDDFYGPDHASTDTETTVCGIVCSGSNWYVINNSSNGKVTCKKCLLVLNESPMETN